MPDTRPRVVSRGRVLVDGDGNEAHNLATATTRLLSAAGSTNATLVKGSPGSVVSITGYCARATPVYLKFYDKATAPTVGTDTPRKTVYLPPLSAFAIQMNDYYATGIGFGMTTAAADASTAAVTAGDVLALNVDYH